LEHSLTVLLPIHDTQATLSTTVQQLLDVLPDLTKRFEVLIVDNGAPEGTSETAHELARNFPQVRVVHQGRLPSREAAIRTGLERSTGEIVMLGEDGCGFRIDDIHKLWRTMEQGDPTAEGPGGLDAEGTPDTEVPLRSPGLRVLRRTPAAQSGQPKRVDEPPPQPQRPKFLARLRDFALGQ